MGSRRFTREFNQEAVKLVVERGVSVAQAARDLGLHVKMLHRWIKAHKAHGAEAFPGHGRLRPDDAEVARLKRELARTKAERDILKKSGIFSGNDATASQ